MLESEWAVAGLGLGLGLFFDHDAGVDSVGYDGLFAPSAR